MAEGQIAVWFPCGTTYSAVLRTTTAPAGSGQALADAVRQWMEGPTPSEREDGLRDPTGFDGMLDAQVIDGTVVVNITSDPDGEDFQLYTETYFSLAYTVYPYGEGIEIRVGGKPVSSEEGPLDRHPSPPAR